MVRLGSTATEDPSRAAKYLAIGRSLHRNTQELETISETRYGNGLAIIAIHAAIAYTDALTIAFRGIKSQDGDHARAADVLAHALGQNRSYTGQVNRLRGILQAKSNASYSGQYYSLEEGQRIAREAGEFIRWAEDMLANRPSQSAA
ncbi:MAG TPA: hypothetical protein VLK84_24810 [Longimicrobium sp.]|nr:hypothetical protein [Longimicrobium sp.]